jgi:hypothetical protein
MRPIQKVLSFATADPNGIAEGQVPVDAVDLTLDGVYVDGGIATLPLATTVTLTSGDDLSGATFTVIGTAANGNVISEVIVGPNNATVTTTLEFATVTSIEVATLITYTTEEIEVGATVAGDLGDTAWWPLDIYTPNQVTTISANIISGTATYSVQYTNEDPFDTSITQLAVAHPAAGGAFTSATTDQTHFTTTLMRAVRVNVASGVGDLRVTVVQQSTA